MFVYENGRVTWKSLFVEQNEPDCGVTKKNVRDIMFIRTRLGGHSVYFLR